ncbi:hypothetical protein IAU60_005787 [Kwoniella sp. DSM 27419]
MQFIALLPYLCLLTGSALAAPALDPSSGASLASAPDITAELTGSIPTAPSDLPSGIAAPHGLPSPNDTLPCGPPSPMGNLTLPDMNETAPILNGTGSMQPGLNVTTCMPPINATAPDNATAVGPAGAIGSGDASSTMELPGDVDDQSDLAI